MYFALNGLSLDAFLNNVKNGSLNSDEIIHLKSFEWFPSDVQLTQIKNDNYGILVDCITKGYNKAKERLYNFGRELFIRGKGYTFENFIDDISAYKEANIFQARALFNTTRKAFVGFEFLPTSDQLIQISLYTSLSNIIYNGYLDAMHNADEPDSFIRQ